MVEIRDWETGQLLIVVEGKAAEQGDGYLIAEVFGISKRPAEVTPGGIPIFRIGDRRVALLRLDDPEPDC